MNNNENLDPTKTVWNWLETPDRDRALAALKENGDSVLEVHFEVQYHGSDLTHAHDLYRLSNGTDAGALNAVMGKGDEALCLVSGPHSTIFEFRAEEIAANPDTEVWGDSDFDTWNSASYEVTYTLHTA